MLNGSLLRFLQFTLWDGPGRRGRAPKTLSGPGSRWTWFRVSFFACFGTPWDPGNGAPMQAGARFPENQLFELGVEKGPQNAAQNDPKRAPGGSQSGKIDAQSRHEVFVKFVCGEFMWKDNYQKSLPFF